MVEAVLAMRLFPSRQPGDKPPAPLRQSTSRPAVHVGEADAGHLRGNVRDPERSGSVREGFQSGNCGGATTERGSL
jgi:hypothetical protein